MRSIKQRLGISHHRIRLSTSSLPISTNTSVISLESISNRVQTEIIEDGELGSIVRISFREAPIRGVIDKFFVICRQRSWARWVAAGWKNNGLATIHLYDAPRAQAQLAFVERPHTNRNFHRRTHLSVYFIYYRSDQTSNLWEFIFCCTCCCFKLIKKHYILFRFSW